MKNYLFAFFLFLLIIPALSSQETGLFTGDGEPPVPERAAAQRAAKKTIFSAPEKENALIHFGAWGKAVWAPLVYKGDADGLLEGADGAVGEGDGPGIGMGGGPGWDHIGAAVGFEMWGENREHTGGFEIKLRVKSWTNNGPALYANDNTAYLWARIFDMLTMKFGLWRYDDFRGTIAEISELAGVYGGDEDTIFQRAESDAFGALFILTPPSFVPEFLKGLTVFTALGVSGTTDINSDAFAALTRDGLAYMLAAPHMGLGYKIEDIGFARVQYIGRKYKWGHGDDWFNNGTYWYPSHTGDSDRVECAFTFVLIKNLNLDLGAGIPFSVTVGKDDTGTEHGAGPSYRELGVASGLTRDYRIARFQGDVYTPPLTLAAAAEYRLGKIDFRGRLKLSLGEKVVYDAGGDNFTGGFDIEGAFETAYRFKFGALSANIAFRNRGNDYLENNAAISHNGTVDLGLGSWFTGELGSGVTLKCGVTANIPIGGDAYFWTLNGTKNQINAKTAERNSQLIVMIPVILTVSLF